ncbi:MAG: TIGR00159 family protein [Desulfuromonadales bacterium]|nr:TIGR00159 family protein [Desulfuromonadales bacterium]
MSPSFIRIQDVADILIMTFLLYQLYSWFYRTRAMQVLLGLGVVTLIYFATRFLGLYMTSWILQELGTVLIILLIVVFQSEIRQTLYRFSMLRHLFERRTETKPSDFQEIAETLFSLAAKRTGALLVFERNEPLEDLMLNGVRLDCEITSQILEAIFMDGTPLHDGAALIRENRIAVASCHLPLSVNPDIPQYLGTRHRAALGLSERTDAIVAAVSEERGTVSLAVGSELQIFNSPGELIAALGRLIDPVRERARMLPRLHLFSNLLPKTAILVVVTIFWALITSRQGQIITVTAPVRLHGIPERLALVRSSPEEVDVQLKSFSILTPLPSKLDLAADIDLSGIREGQAAVRIKNTDFKLPSGMEMTAVNPPTIRIVTDRKERKRVPVRVTLRGGSGRGLRGQEVTADPSTVEVEGPASQVGRIDMVVTEEIDAGRLLKGQEYKKNLLPPENNIVILREEPITIRLVLRRKK